MRRHRPCRPSLLLIFIVLVMMMAVMVSATEGDAVRAAANMQQQQERHDDMDEASVIPGEEVVVEEQEEEEQGVAQELKEDTSHGKAPSTSPRQEEKTLGEILRIAGLRALGGGIPGAMAGMLQVMCLMWLRTINNYQNRYGASFRDAVAILYKQGGIRRFYEGMAFALIQGPLSRFGSTAANDGCRALLKNFQSTRGLPLFFSTALASFAAGAWRIFLMPVDTAKTVLQVEGHEGFRSLVRRIGRGEISALYQGALATALAAALGHFPWFFTHNLLNEVLRPARGGFSKLCRNAVIGFVASVVSDLITNVVRVVKTIKQASFSSISYAQTVQIVLAADGWRGLFGRGLSTRILTNGLQSMLFSVVWKALSESALFKAYAEPKYEDDDDVSLQEPLHKASTTTSQFHEDQQQQEGADPHVTFRGGQRSGGDHPRVGHAHQD